jgi:hypothetical protein
MRSCDRLDYAVYNKTNGMRCPRAAVIGWGKVRPVSGPSRFRARLPRQAEYYHRSRDDWADGESDMETPYCKRGYFPSANLSYGQLVAEESRASNPKKITNLLKVEGDIGRI